MTAERPVVRTSTGLAEGVWRDGSAAFYGIPYAQAPIGELRFAAPAPALAWEGVRDAAAPGATPQRRPFGPVTTIPEPCFPGDETLNVNVFTPVPGESDAGLPVFVWIHGGGFFAGSAASPWYDGRSFNRDGIVTVALSYRLGFDGFGWISDAPSNRGLRDQIAGLEWVRDNITAFGGDPGNVTIAGQSAGGSSVMCMLASPLAAGLFHRVVCHSGAGMTRTVEASEVTGREFAAAAGVEPTRAGWSALTEDEILDAQFEFQRPTTPPPATPGAYVRRVLTSGGIPLPFIPVSGDDVLPDGVGDAVRNGAGREVDLMAGTVAHEFTMVMAGNIEAWKDVDPVEALVDGGMTREAAEVYIALQPELTTTALQVGQVGTDMQFRIPTIRWAAAHGGRTWVYDFRLSSPVGNLASHCLELPYAWDVLDAEGVTEVWGENPPQALADEMHAAWVRFITTGDPGWDAWNGHNPRVFGGAQADSYAATRLVSRAAASL